MELTEVRFRINSVVKEEAEKVLNTNGLTLEEFMVIILRKIAGSGEIPQDLRLSSEEEKKIILKEMEEKHR